MHNQIIERDWKIYRELHQTALERFCDQVLTEVSRVTSEPGKTSHERYLALYKLVEKRDEELARLFDDMRRSTALQCLVCIQGRDLLTEEEMSRFSPETRDYVQNVLSIVRGAAK